MSTTKIISHHISRIYYTMTSNKRFLTYHCRGIFISIWIFIVRIKWFSNNTIITYYRIIANYHIIVNHCIISNLNILSNRCRRTYIDIFVVKFHFVYILDILDSSLYNHSHHIFPKQVQDTRLLQKNYLNPAKFLEPQVSPDMVD